MRLHLFFLIDALGWEIASREHFLEGFAAVRSPASPVLGYSCACIPSLLTGRLPREHGRWAMYRRDPARSPFRSHRWLLRLAALTGREEFVRRRLRAAVGNGGGYNGYWQLYAIPVRHLPELDVVEKEDLFAPGGVPGYPTVIDLIARGDATWRGWNWRTPEPENFRAFGEAIDRERHGALFLYAPDLDALMHAEGTGSPSVSARVAWYDATIREMTERARRRYDDVRVVVMSDHGMADTIGTHDLWTPLRALGLREPADVFFFLDSTMARFWFGGDAARRKVLALLAEQPYGHVLSPEEERRHGVDFASREYGETTFLLDPGHLIVPSYMGSHASAGMHGFDPDAPPSTAFFASTMPLRAEPRSILDVKDVVEREILA